MAVTSHVYPKFVNAVNQKTLNLAVSGSSPAFIAGLCTGSAATWGSTQEAYQYVSDITGAYTEVTGGGYARTSAFVTVTLTVSGAKDIWTVTSPAPISFGSSVTISAASMFIYTTQVGSADSSYPVACIIDFGGTVTSTSGAFTYTVDPTNGLAYWNSI
jgi:hypothetical protein